MATKGKDIVIELALCLDWRKGKEKKIKEDISIVWFQGWKGNLRVMMEIQTVLPKKKKLQTVDVIRCGKWLLVNEKMILVMGLNEN